MPCFLRRASPSVLHLDSDFPLIQGQVRCDVGHCKHRIWRCLQLLTVCLFQTKAKRSPCRHPKFVLLSTCQSALWQRQWHRRILHGSWRFAIVQIGVQRADEVLEVMSGIRALAQWQEGGVGHSLAPGCQSASVCNYMERRCITNVYRNVIDPVTFSAG